MLTIERGIMPALLKAYKKAAATGGQVSGAEDTKILNQGLQMIRDEFDGASSERGLAAARNALAKSRRAAARNWDFTAKADEVAASFLGAGFDGKSGKLAKVEQKLRNSIRGDSTSIYG